MDKQKYLEKLKDNEIKEYYNNYSKLNKNNIRKQLIIMIDERGYFPAENELKQQFNIIGSIDLTEVFVSSCSKYEKINKIVNLIYTAILNDRKLKKKIKIARNIGLNYWPALVYGPNIDPIAYKIADKILSAKYGKWGKSNHGGWDMWGDKGVSPIDVAKFWFASGCKPNTKFMFQVRNEFLAFKHESLNQLICRFRGDRWLSQNLLYSKWLFSNKAIYALGRISAPLRWAAIKNIDFDTFNIANAKIRISDLNWGEVKRVQSKNYLKAQNCPPRLQWQILIGQCPDGLEKYSPLTIKRSLYEELSMICNIDPYNGPDTNEGHRLPCWKLASLLNNVQEIKQYAKKCNKPMNAIGIHDMGQFSTPSSKNDDWKKLCMKYGSEITEYCSLWSSIENQNSGNVPDNLTELRQLANLCSYTNIINSEVALAASRAKLAQSEFEQYQSWYMSLNIKTYETIPCPNIIMNDIVLRKLSYNDPSAPLMGLHTNCCQHPNGAAHSCAKAAIEDPNCAIWVFEKNDEILAQTFVWRHENVLIFDSIESKDRSTTMAEKLEKIFMLGIKSVLGRLGINEVRFGDTSYGLTLNFVGPCGVWSNMVKKLYDDNHIPPRTSYSDAHAQVKLCIG